MSHLLNLADDFPRTAAQAPGGIMPAGTTSYSDADGALNNAVTLPTAIGRRNEILTITHDATADVVLQGTNKTPATALTLSAANRVTRWISDGATWRAVEDSKTGGNVTAKLSNVTPIAVLPVGDLFEVTMPANTDVRIRSLVNRQVYLTSEGEYSGGSFTTTTSAIVNLTPTFVPADNNVHVNGELNRLTIQDILSGRLFTVTVWRLAGIAGNWSGWVEEIGVSFSGPAPAQQDFFRTLTGATLPDGTNDLTEAISRTGMVYAKGFKAESGLPVGGAATSDQSGFYFNGPEGDGGMHSFPGVDGAIGFATNAVTGVILRSATGGSAWTLNGGTIAAASAINAYHYIGIPAGPGVASRVGISSGGASVGQTDAISQVLTNANKTNLTGPVGIIGASDAANPGGLADIGANIKFWRQGNATNNLLGFGVETRSALGLSRRFNIYPNGIAAFDCDANVTGLIWQTARGNVPAISVSHNGIAFSVVGAAPYTVVSDRKYKADIKTISRDLAAKAIKSVNPSTWSWNDLALKERGQSGSGFGFIAQNVQEFVPEAVIDAGDGTLAVAESKLIPYLWAQVQSLTEQMERLMAGAVAPAPVTAVAVPTSTAPLSVNLAKVDRLLKMDATGLGAIGFTATQSMTFTAGSTALRAGMASGLPEAEILKVLSTLLTSIGLSLSGVLAKL